MVCTTASCGTLGRAVLGRNRPGYDVRMRGEPMGDTATPLDGTVMYDGAPGMPLTEAQRQQRHLALYGTTNVPPRGTGMLAPQRLEFDFGSVVAGIVIGFIIGGMLLTSTGREIGYRAGRRVARKI